MVITSPLPESPKARRRKSLFPFTQLLRSTEYKGKGACLAENVIIRNGRLKKLTNPSSIFTKDNVDSLKAISGFKKENGEYLIFYLVDSTLSGKYLLEAYNIDTDSVEYPLISESEERALTGTFTFTNGSPNVSISGGSATTEISVGDTIYLDGEYSSGARVQTVTDDDNIVLASNYAGAGGAGSGKSSTKHLTTERVYMRQLGDEAYFGTFEASNNGFSYDSGTFANISNFPAYARYLVLDGNRVVVNEQYSGEISTTMTDFTSGSGVQSSGRYATSLTANGAIETSAGIIFMADIGGELHKVIPNNASDDVSAQTKKDTFNYTGQGVQNTDQIIMGENYCYIVNKKGIIEINPFSGQSRILTDVGNIGRRWLEYDVDSAIIEYDSNDNKIVCLVKQIGQYDTMVILDLDFKDRPISTQPNSYLQSIVNVNNQLYGGSSIDGQLFELFDDFTDRDDQPVKFRWILEWDALDGISTENIFKQIRIHHNLNPRSSVDLKLYKNGSTEPIETKTVTSGSTVNVNISGVIATMGFYLSGLGRRLLDVFNTNIDLLSKLRKTARVVTYTLEVVEESVYDYEVYDIIIEYKDRMILSRNKTLPNTLF